MGVDKGTDEGFEEGVDGGLKSVSKRVSKRDATRVSGGGSQRVSSINEGCDKSFEKKRGSIRVR